MTESVPIVYTIRTREGSLITGNADAVDVDDGWGVLLLTLSGEIVAAVPLGNVDYIVRQNSD